MSQITSLKPSEWVIKFNGLSGDSGQWGPYSPYKLCNRSQVILYVLINYTHHWKFQSKPQAHYHMHMTSQTHAKCINSLWPEFVHPEPYCDTFATIFLSWYPTGEPGPWFNIKMSSYQYRKSHCGDKTVITLSYLHNGISYTGKTSLYWIRTLEITKKHAQKCNHKHFPGSTQIIGSLLVKSKLFQIVNPHRLSSNLRQ